MLVEENPQKIIFRQPERTKLKHFGTDKYTIILIVVILKQNVLIQETLAQLLHSREQNMYIY